MSDRILKVNAYTTLDLLDGRAEGHGFEEDALAVLNVTADRKNPDAVKLQLELDNTDLDAVPAHADEIELTPSRPGRSPPPSKSAPRRSRTRTTTEPIPLLSFVTSLFHCARATPAAGDPR